MKKLNLIPTAVVMIAILVTSCGGNTSSKSTITDTSSNESTSSNEVTIGTQVWMTKNLDVDKFRNGDVIPEAKTEGEWIAYGDAGEAAWCYYDNDKKNGEKYGKLYNWHAVNDSRGLAPKGWHIPSHAEWTKLIYFLGGIGVAGTTSGGTTSGVAGTKMKSTDGWEGNGNGTNESGFSGLPGGNRNYYGSFGIGKYGYWWSSTEASAFNAWSGYLDYSNGNLDRYFSFKKHGYSVRCLRD